MTVFSQTEHTTKWWLGPDVVEADLGKMQSSDHNHGGGGAGDYYRDYQQPLQVKYELKDENTFRRPSNSSINLTHTHSAATRIKGSNYDEWLKVEVCREHQRGKCNREPLECKYAHPRTNVIVENGKVTACYDFLKGKCHRGDSCKFIHPENPNIKAQLEMNGRNAQYQRKLNRGMVMNQNPMTGYATTMVPTVQPTVVPAHTPIIWAEPATTAPTNQNRALRADRLEICRDFLRSTCTRNDMLKEGRSTEKMSGSLCKYAHPEKIKDEYNTDRAMIDETDQTVIVCMDFVKGKCHRDMKCKYYHPEAHLINEIKHRQSLLSSQLHAQNNNAQFSFKSEPILAAGSSTLQTSFSVPVVPNIKYEPSIQQNEQYRRQMQRTFDQRGASPSPVQTPTSQPWTTGYTTSTPQTSFVPMTVYNYASNQFGQNMSAGNMFQNNGAQQQQTINPMTMSIGTWSNDVPSQEMRMEHHMNQANLVFQQHGQTQQYEQTGGYP